MLMYRTYTACCHIVEAVCLGHYGHYQAVFESASLNAAGVHFMMGEEGAGC